MSGPFFTRLSRCRSVSVSDSSACQQKPSPKPEANCLNCLHFQTVDEAAPSEKDPLFFFVFICVPTPAVSFFFLFCLFSSSSNLPSATVFPPRVIFFPLIIGSSRQKSPPFRKKPRGGGALYTTRRVLRFCLLSSISAFGQLSRWRL